MKDKVGKFFTTNGRDVWKLISYCQDPTATFENVDTKEHCGGGIYSPNVGQFIELVPAIEIEVKDDPA